MADGFTTDQISRTLKEAVLECITENIRDIDAVAETIKIRLLEKYLISGKGN